MSPIRRERLRVESLEDRVMPALFAITQDNIVAQDLPFGPTLIAEADNAFFSTASGAQMHNKWTQVAVANSGT